MNTANQEGLTGDRAEKPEEIVSKDFNLSDLTGKASVSFTSFPNSLMINLHSLFFQFCPKYYGHYRVTHMDLHGSVVWWGMSGVQANLIPESSHPDPCSVLSHSTITSRSYERFFSG